eukprot:CAMPEP_0168621662 /NCGR_PEP_ID=MMETSP0449_2-20121227/7825_1 /TAXON_ID=1082188 /ORGANISM="Strombidium rassoulzadegani, Strain ras09" /LENGTH=90 /DNA_ID=CAMNT_0008662819 /DNA_START=467 /DNA_END=736 /DNA_ORIENTATION=+
MIASEFSNQNQGGGPAAGMPMRGESFFYPGDPLISNVERIVQQGRIKLGDNENEESAPHYWGSYEQGVRRPMEAETPTCVDRYTFLVFTV